MAAGLQGSGTLIATAHTTSLEEIDTTIDREVGDLAAMDAGNAAAQVPLPCAYFGTMP